MVKVSELRNAMEALPGSFLNDPFKNEIFHIVGSGEDNASDTVADGDVSSDDWEDVARRTIEMTLCDRSTSDAARAWFAAQGLKF